MRNRLAIYSSNYKIKWHVHGDRDLLECGGCPFSSSAFQVGHIPLSDVCLGRKFELRHIAPFAQNTQRIFAVRDTVDNLLRNKWSAGCYLLTCARDKPRAPDVLIGFGGLGSQCLIFLAGENGDLALFSLLETHIHEGCPLSHKFLCGYPPQR